MQTDIHFWSYLAQFCLEWKVFQIKLYRKSRHTIYARWAFCENPTVYVMMWENIVEPDRPQTTMWPKHLTCWIPKATNTLCFSTTTTVARTRPNVTLHSHCLSCSLLLLRKMRAANRSLSGPGDSRSSSCLSTRATRLFFRLLYFYPQSIWDYQYMYDIVSTNIVYRDLTWWVVFQWKLSTLCYYRVKFILWKSLCSAFGRSAVKIV
jgi:hypothetical protein